MNDKTKYEILRRREMMKAYTVADVGTEPTDQQQKLPFPAPIKAGKGTFLSSVGNAGSPPFCGEDEAGYLPERAVCRIQTCF